MDHIICSIAFLAWPELQSKISELNSPTIILPPPIWKERDTTWLALYFFPLNTLRFRFPLWNSIEADEDKAITTIKYLSKLLIESSKKFAMDRRTSGQYRRAEYRMWPILRLANKHAPLSLALRSQIDAAKIAFCRIYVWFGNPSTSISQGDIEMINCATIMNTWDA